MPEIPLVVDDSSESITKTSKAVQILKSIGAYDDAEKAKDSKNVRRGKGKMRNRRYVNRKGPLVIYGNDNGIAKAFRNLPGVDTAPVSALNLMQVCAAAASKSVCTDQGLDTSTCICSCTHVAPLILGTAVDIFLRFLLRASVRCLAVTVSRTVLLHHCNGGV